MECEAVDPRASVAVDVVAEGSCCNRPRISKLQDSSGNYVKNHLSPKKAFLNVFRTLKRKLVDQKRPDARLCSYSKKHLQPENVKKAVPSLVSVEHYYQMMLFFSRYKITKSKFNLK